MQKTATSKSPAATRRRGTGPSVFARVAVIAPPAIPPRVPPSPIAPKRRLACSDRKRSARKPQKTETMSRLNVLTKTKKKRAVAIRWLPERTLSAT